MKIAFQGIHGAYSEAAAKELYGSCTTIPYPAFAQVFAAVEGGRADRGIIPIENSLAGSIHENYDLLLSHNVHIVDEIPLRIEHVLMCTRDSSFGRIRRVRSHPQALAQCGQFFSRNRRITPVAYFDTAGAAESLRAEPDPTTAAIASEYAARLYGLKILKRNIESRSNNFTRFLIIARKPRVPSAGIPTKCSIAFKPMRNRVGILFRLLGVFALRDIDLLKIESRPDPRSTFQYLFYIDFAGNPRDPHVIKALDHLREMVREFRLLGAYPVNTADGMKGHPG